MPLNLDFFKAEIAKYKSSLKMIEVSISKGYDKEKSKWSRMYLTIKDIFEEPSEFLPSNASIQTIMNLIEEFGLNLENAKSIHHLLMYDRDPEAINKLFFKQIKH